MKAEQEMTQAENRPSENTDAAVFLKASGLTLRDAALTYACAAFSVVPIYGVAEGICTCPRGPSCESPGKHPRVAGGVHAATSNEEQIEKWWNQWPDANIGLAVPQRYLVIDVDGPVGFESLASRGFDLPLTLTIQTSPGRAHYWYRSEVAARNRVRILPGVDIRGHDGIAVVPPSCHAGGGLYKILDQTEIASAPEWLRKTVKAIGRRNKKDYAGIASVLRGVPEGIRDSSLYRYACRLVAKRLDEAEEDGLIRIAASECEPPYPEEIALNKLRGARDFVKRQFRLTDVGNAERFVEMHGRDLRHSDSAGGWFVWDGTRWRKDETGEVFRRARETAEKIYGEAKYESNRKLAAAILKWARSTESKARLEAMVHLAKTDSKVVVRPESFDQDGMLLNVSNGTVDLRTGLIRPHQREDLITKLASVCYDPRASAPLWRNFLVRITDKNEYLLDFLCRAVGYSFTGDISEHVFFLLYGTGANGKSTFLETLRHVLGDYAMQADFATFTSGRSAQGGPRNDVARLKGARLVSAVEMEAGSHLSETVVKQVTGGDTVTARYLFREYFEFRPEFKLFLAANHRPNVRQTDEGIWRRILFVPFTVTIPPGERDRKLVEKLECELAGILNWALEGVKGWLRDGLAPPEIVRQATSDYRSDNDPLTDFIADECILDPGQMTTFTELYAAYISYSEQYRQEALSARQFSDYLSQRGIPPHKGSRGVRMRRGIALVVPDLDGMGKFERGDGVAGGASSIFKLLSS